MEVKMTNRNPKNTITFRSAFEADKELKKHGASALSLFVLSLYLRLEDIDEFAANAITDGGNDKKADICYLDEENGRLIIVQSYLATTWTKKSAPDKASDLNTAIAWLFSANVESVPPGLQAKAIEIREAIKKQTIKQIEIFYIHNCPESKNISGELATVSSALADILKSITQNNIGSIRIWHREFGLNAIEGLYKSRDSQILIDNWLDIPIENKYLEEKTGNWKAILTTVPASWISGLYKKYDDNLFSANYRDFLGYSEDEDNVNYQIVNTANSEPNNFWVYNNGITALTHEIKFKSRSKKIRGISIINGAQTSGALSATSDVASSQAKVLIRIVECQSSDLVDNIIQYNNTQNEIKPEDRRSKDPLQKRLGEDFGKYNIEYYYRRSKQKISKITITAKSIAPALCAIHGDPQISYRDPKKIFKDEDTYQKVFPHNIQVEHIFLVRSLSIAIDTIKKELKEKVSNDSATDQEKIQFQVLKYSASKHFVFYVVGALIEEILKKHVTNLFECKCKPEVIAPNNRSLLDAWDMALRTLLPHIGTLIRIKRRENDPSDPFYEVPRSDKLSKEVAEELKPIIASLEPSLGKQFSALRKRVTV